MIQIGADFSTSGVPETGLSPTITIRDTSDGSVVVNGAAMTEVGGGAYKYNFTNDTAKKYSAIIDGGVDTLDSRYMTAWSERAKVEAEVTALQADLDNGTDGLGALKALIDAVPTASEIQTEIEANGASVIDTIRDYIENVTYGLSALKTLIDAVPTATENRQEMDNNSTRLDANISTRSSHNAAAVKTAIEAVGTKLTDLHDEALGKWELDHVAKTLTLYKSDGVTPLKVFDLVDTGSTVPVFISRTPQ